MEDQKPKTSFTGIRRNRKTSRRVVISDFLARFLITFGGIGTILAVMTVCIFLAMVVVPLFQSAKVTSQAKAPTGFTEAPIHVSIDEYQRLGYAFYPDGQVRVFRIDTGRTIDQIKLFEGRKVTSHSFASRGGTFVLGFDDGSFQFGKAFFSTRFFDPKVEAALAASVDKEPIVEHKWPAQVTNDQGESVKITRSGIVDRIPTGDLRGHYLETSLEKPRKVGAPILLIDHVIMADGAPTVVTFTNDGKPALAMHSSRKVTNATTGIDEFRFSRPTEIALKQSFEAKPGFLRISSAGSNTYLCWADGRTWRYRLSPPDTIEFAEEVDLIENPTATLTALEFVIGRETLMAGGSDGSLSGWFTIPFDGQTIGWEPIFFRSTEQQQVKNPVLWVFKEGSSESREFHHTGDLPNKVVREKAMKGGVTVVGSSASVIDQYLAAIPVDGRKLVKSKELAGGNAAVTSISPSQRSRLVAAGFADGTASLYSVTAESRLIHIDEPGKKIDQILIAPKDDTFGAITAGEFIRWTVDIKHPEASVKSMFAKVWYEGYEEPKHMWQSSSGTDESEPKFGLMPLIYGTLKATFYSMLVGVPLALLAAVYTSEFLKPRFKSRIKPMIEMMASLPSVVLGFIAAIWLAPRVEQNLSGVLSLLLCVPLFFLLGAYLWQLMPYSVAVRYREYRFALMFLIALPLGVCSALYVAGPIIENSFLLGDIQKFLNGSKEIPTVGSPVAAWMILLLPISIFIMSLLNGRFVTPKFRVAATTWTRQQTATYDFFKFIAFFLLSLLVAFILSLAFGSVLDDPRGKGSPIDTFDPRNALVVGFIMGFAIIPIIYTIAEDAMSTVPDHLRAASLGAGATHWQTAVRIVIPTAMSGLFSACMIGLGRAVGETMIVLMAAGGTAIMEPNIFNGFRTLSANIATELPEAPPDTTHYRTLFLAGLVLFVMTFAVNTVAESVRQRFRKRAFQL